MTSALIEKEKISIKFEEDPSFSAIVPIHNLDGAILKRCLMSLWEQNYKNFEVILVFDGKDEKLEEVAQTYLDRNDNWKKVVIEHKGACAARNAGFSVSKGDIVAFINSDYVLKRGIIRLWVDRLLENKDCGFVYGGYEYNTRERNWYQSKPFDAYQLEIANYIDCGFPLWRKYCVPWDESVKSLQDWDFWIRVVKEHKVKGYFLGRDISFVAEPPRANGLTADSSSHWIDRVNYIKNKNGIPLRDICMTSIGATYHGAEIAKMIDADFRDDTIFKPNEYKALYLIGFYMKPGEMGNQHGPILNYYEKTKRIVHWVGADLYWMRKFSFEDLHNLGGALKISAIHLVENEMAQKELKDLLGLDSEIVPIPPYNDYEIKPLPDKFSIGVFFTKKSDFDKYYKEQTLSIIRACPDIQFNSYGDGAEDIHYHNLKNFGMLSKKQWKEFVYNNSCLLRLVRHDTTPLANAEFMMAGRSVISNIPDECTHYVNTSGDSEINKWDTFQPGFTTERWSDTKKKIIQSIRKIKKSPPVGLRFIDNVGIIPIPEFLKERFNREKYINKIYELSNVKRRIQ